MATIREEYERVIKEIRDEKDPVLQNALKFAAFANLYIYQHVCHVIENEMEASK